MIKKLLKKGFTIVELVIVVAVVAALAAVLIPTFSNVVEKANNSADIQNITNINTQLKLDETLNGKPQSKDKVIELLQSYNFSTDDIKSNNYILYWNKTDNVIVIIDTKQENKVVFPEQYKDQTIENEEKWEPLGEIAPSNPGQGGTGGGNENPQTYTITFDTDGGSQISSITSEAGMTITSPTDPTKTGYTFGGWDTEIPSTMPAENITITALWTINQYTITFDTDGGTSIDPITRDYGSIVTAPAEPTKTGYIFTGWDITFPTTMPAENITVKAKWSEGEYKIIFDTDGGTEVSPLVQDYNTVITTPMAPTKEGYTFVGWEPALPATMPAENITVKAKWTINQYTITFDTDGGSSITSITQDYGTSVISPENPIKSGYTFAGWEPALPATMPAENITVKAKWVAGAYTITFDSNDGSAVNPIVAVYGTNIEAPSAPIRDGYTFSGWSPSLPSTMPAENITVVAQWTINQYTIQYKIVEEDSSITNFNATQSSYTILDNITLEAPTRDCYTFNGWYETQECTGTPITNITNGSKGNRVFYGKFTPIIGEIKVKYYLNDGSDNEYNEQWYNLNYVEESSNYKEVNLAVLPMPYREGYVFCGWAMSPNTPVDAYNEFIEVIDLDTQGGAFTLYAIWKQLNINALTAELNSVKTLYQQTQPNSSNDVFSFITASDTHERAYEDLSINWGESWNGNPTEKRIIDRNGNANAGYAAGLMSQNTTLNPTFLALLGDFAAGDKYTSLEGGKQSIQRVIEYYSSAINNSNLLTMITTGNHDPLTKNKDKNNSYLTNESLANIYNQDSTYFYKDISSSGGKKIRIIMLNTADVETYTSGSYVEGMSATQLTWFAQTLAETESNGVDGIILFSHHPLDYVTAKVTSNNTAAMKVINAYLQGGSYENVSFANKNTAKIIGAFHGHIHCFYMSTLDGTDVPNIAIPNASYERNNEYGYEDTTYKKDSNPVNTSLCYISVDLTDMKIYAYTYGAGPDLRTASFANKYDVTSSLSAGLSLSSLPEQVEEGQSINTSLIINSNYVLSNLTIKMGDTDITNTSYDYTTNKITISNVIGNVSISASAVLNTVGTTYTNLVPTSLSSDGTTVYNNYGYADGKYVSESGNYGVQSNCTATGYIPYNGTDVIYVKGVEIKYNTDNQRARIFMNSNTSGASNQLATVLDSSKFPTLINTFANSSGPIIFFKYVQLGEQYYKIIPTSDIALDKVEYYRASFYGTGENMIITHNQPIVKGLNYSVTYDLIEGITSSSDVNEVIPNGTYTTTLTIPTGFVGKVTVIMGGSVQKEYSYNGEAKQETIQIVSVTGNIEINSNGYTNLVKTSLDNNLTSIYNGKGYKENTYISEGSYGTKTNSVATGLIELTIGKTSDVIYIYGINFDYDPSIVETRIYVFKDPNTNGFNNYTFKRQMGSKGNLNTFFKIEKIEDNYYKLTIPEDSQFFDGSFAAKSQNATYYYRASGFFAETELIISHNKPIF